MVGSPEKVSWLFAAGESEAKPAAEGSDDEIGAEPQIDAEALGPSMAERAIAAAPFDRTAGLVPPAPVSAAAPVKIAAERTIADRVNRTVDQLMHIRQVRDNLSDRAALHRAVTAYFNFTTDVPGEVNPFFFFVDFGQPNDANPRGYLLNMQSSTLVTRPFTVSHGGGSRGQNHSDWVPRVIPKAAYLAEYGGPGSAFSNKGNPPSELSSLGLFRAEFTSAIHHGRRADTGSYTSPKILLNGISDSYNDAVRARHIWIHNIPGAGIGRTSGCPAVPASVLPILQRHIAPRATKAGLVFIDAPVPSWIAGDPWLRAE